MTKSGIWGTSLGISGTSKLGTGASSVLCAWGRKAVLAGGVFYSCLLCEKKKTNPKPHNCAVSCKHKYVMETNVFSFACGLGGNWTDQVSWPGSG